MAFNRLGIVAGFAAVMIIGSSSFTATAVAQTAMPTQVESVPKGAIGLGLVGAELGLVLPAAFGLAETWSMIVFPIVGGTAGAIGGYFAFDESNVAEGGVAMLAIGMALVVPAMVLTLVFTSYDGDDDVAPEDEGEGNYDEEFGGDADASARRDSAQEVEDAQERIAAGAGLLHVGSRSLSLGVPGVSVRPSLSAEEMQRYGGEQTAEVHLPVVSGSF
ncbi:MAG: hypothetical protein DRJ42_29960 [Deltaproteobacteria bacterium]|nr:MAG: hypothetical protein DRJ42_29960 [Deltaproteobacteria bacterium]